MQNKNTKTIVTMSWGLLLIVATTLFLFLFAFAKTATVDKIVDVEGFVFEGDTIISYTGDKKILEIPGCYSLGPTHNVSGTITFNNRSQAYDFADEYYISGTEGYYDFYNEIYNQTYPWVYEYSIDVPSFIRGNKIKVKRCSWGAFENNKKLEKVIIPGNIENLGVLTFRGCTNLKEVVLNEGIKDLGDSSFEGTIIEKITIPDSVEDLGAYTFFRCSKLKEITIGKNVKTTTLGTFYHCDNLETVYINSDFKIKASYTDVYDVFKSCANLKSVYVKDEFVDYYKTTAPWSFYRSKIKPLSEKEV